VHTTSATTVILVLTLVTMLICKKSTASSVYLIAVCIMRCLAMCSNVTVAYRSRQFSISLCTTRHASSILQPARPAQLLLGHHLNTSSCNHLESIRIISILCVPRQSESDDTDCLHWWVRLKPYAGALRSLRILSSSDTPVPQ
jgi:hypothetical protein